MFGADLMIRTNDRPLKQAPDALNGVSVNIATHPLFGAVVNGLMCCVGVGNTKVTGSFIGHQAFGLGINSLCHERMKHFSTGLLAAIHAKPDLSAAFYGSEYHRLSFETATAHVTLLAAAIGLVKLDGPSKGLRVDFQHGLSDAVAEIPCGLIADSQHALELIGRNAFLRLDHHVGSKEPLCKGQMRVMEDRTGSYGELIAA